MLLLITFAFAAGVAFHRYAWGPKYAVATVNGATLRIDREGGEAFVLDPDSGWTRIPGPPAPFKPPVDAFADLPDLPDTTTAPRAGGAPRP